MDNYIIKIEYNGKTVFLHDAACDRGFAAAVAAAVGAAVAAPPSGWDSVLLTTWDSGGGDGPVTSEFRDTDCRLFVNRVGAAVWGVEEALRIK
jgi:hypothetical protein